MDKLRPIPFSEFEEEVLKDSEMKKINDELEPEFRLSETVIRKRLKKGLTQKQLAEKIGTKQSAIARLESGNYNASLRLIKKVAQALDTKITITV